MLIKLEWLGYRTVKTYDHMLSRFHPIPGRYGRTNGQTDGRTDWRTELLYQYRASVCWRAIKTALEVLYYWRNETSYWLATDRDEASRGLFATAELLVFSWKRYLEDRTFVKSLHDGYVPRHLVNAYEVKAGIGVIADNTVWSMPERLECEVLQKARYINTLTYLPT